VTRYYPNFHPGLAGRRRRRAAILDGPKRVAEILLLPLSGAAEIVCRHAYAWHLRRKASSWLSPDQVSLEPDYLKLHTQSHRRSVLDRFEQSTRALEKVELRT
jgi:hypothetical protein